MSTILSEIIISDESLEFSGSNIGPLEDSLSLVVQPVYDKNAFRIKSDTLFSEVTGSDTLIGPKDVFTGNLTCMFLQFGNLTGFHIDTVDILVRNNLHCSETAFINILDVNTCLIGEMKSNKITSDIINCLSKLESPFANIDTLNSIQINAANIDTNLILCKFNRSDESFHKIIEAIDFRLNTGNILNVFIDNAYTDFQHSRHSNIDSLHVIESEIEKLHTDVLNSEKLEVYNFVLKQGNILYVHIDDSFIENTIIEQANINNMHVHKSFQQFSEIQTLHSIESNVDLLHVERSILENTDIRNLNILNSILSFQYTTSKDQISDRPADKELVSREYIDLIFANIQENLLTDELRDLFTQSNVDLDAVVANVIGSISTKGFLKTDTFLEYRDEIYEDLESNVEMLRLEADRLYVKKSNIVDLVEEVAGNLDKHVKATIESGTLTFDGSQLFNANPGTGNIDFVQVQKIVDLSTFDTEFFTNQNTSLQYDTNSFKLFYSTSFPEGMVVDGAKVHVNDRIFINILQNVTMKSNLDPTVTIASPGNYNGIYDVISIVNDTTTLILNEHFIDTRDIQSSLIHTKNSNEGGRGFRNSGVDFLITSPNIDNSESFVIGRQNIEFVTIGKQDLIDADAIFAGNLDVYLGTNNNSLRVYATHPARASDRYRPDSTSEVFSVSGEGECVATMFTTPSDRKLKKNIEKIESPSSILKQISGYSFNWIWSNLENNEKKEYGFIAQEIENVLPSMVHTTKDGTKTVDYSKFCAILVESNKEKDQEIKELNSTLTEMKNDISKLQSSIETLHQHLVHLNT